MEFDNNSGNNSVPLTHNVEVWQHNGSPGTLFAYCQGVCVNGAWENEKLYQPRRKAMVCDQMLDLLCRCYLRRRGFVVIKMQMADWYAGCNVQLSLKKEFLLDQILFSVLYSAMYHINPP